MERGRESCSSFTANAVSVRSSVSHFVSVSSSKRFPFGSHRSSSKRFPFGSHRSFIAFLIRFPFVLIAFHSAFQQRSHLVPFRVPTGFHRFLSTAFQVQCFRFRLNCSDSDALPVLEVPRGTSPPRSSPSGLAASGVFSGHGGTERQLAALVMRGEERERCW